jgi:Tol biopolymer transport system component
VAKAHTASRPGLGYVGLTLLLSCGGDGATTPTPSAVTIRIVSGGSTTDTVLAALAEPLEVEVRKANGSIVAHTIVTFESPKEANTGRPTVAFDVGQVALEPDTIGTTTTDDRGRAHCYLRFLGRAGPGRVTVNAAGGSTTVLYTILPGAAVGMAATPKDSTLMVGRSYGVRMALVDRRGNRRSDPVATSAGGPISLGADGRVTATAIGRAYVAGVNGAFRDTAWVSVVPPGRVMAVRMASSSADTAAIVFVDLDGANYRELPITWSVSGHPAWFPDGQRFVREEEGTSGVATPYLVASDLAGRVRPLVDSTLGLLAAYYPRVSLDGQWVYFTGIAPGHRDEIWRIHPDRTGLERVVDAEGGDDAYPDVSPDAQDVAFVSSRICCGDLKLMIVHLATGVVDTVRAGGLPVPALTPRWSPTGDRIAYVNGDALWLIHPDGTQQQRLTATAARYLPHFDWSSDGVWLVARNLTPGRLDLINVASGAVLPLGFSVHLSQPTFAP